MSNVGLAELIKRLPQTYPRIDIVHIFENGGALAGVPSARYVKRLKEKRRTAA